ncbi:hypothetical protein K438DRAFT_1681003 [Mycena galopus ATCC 62051]|nr:hypothetical protein K438DRAFT_1681003 [Mycena galopus ATCC 62051]
MGGQPRGNIRDMIFGIDQETADSDLEELQESEHEIEPQQPTEGEALPWTRPSLYVEVLERAINNIKEEERHLLTEEQWCFILAIGKLTYSSRFILFRILLRKPGKWFRKQDLLKYTSEVGSDGIDDAMEQLSQPLNPRPEPMEVDDGIIDLTGDSDDEDAPPVAGPSSLPQLDEADEERLDYFCQDETNLSLREGLRTLKVDEVKSLCKKLKVQSAKLNKDQIITALMDHSSKQSALNFEPSPLKSKGKGKTKYHDTGLRQTTLSFTPQKTNQNLTSVLRDMMLEVLGKVVRVNPHLHTLMARLHIIWFRSTEFPQSLFRPALFAGFKKLTFAHYEHVRDPDIWRTREEYLDYETGLRTEATIDELLKSESKAGRAAKTPVPADICQRFVTPGIPGLDFIRALTTPAPDDEEDDVVGDTISLQKARAVKRILEEHVLPKWKELLSVESQSTRERKPGLERFEPGFLYTRMLRKCGEALATLKDIAGELKLLHLLLGQRFWRRARRGGWYDRRALLQMKSKKVAVWLEARAGIIEALSDPDTAIVTIPALHRRLDCLEEKKLKLAPEERVKYDGLVLKKPDEVSFIAIRVWDHPNSVKLDWTGNVKGKENQSAGGTGIANYFAVPDTPANGLEAKTSTAKPRWTGKSLWQGKDGPVDVEARALEYYDQVHGFKGFHSETRLLTTLFGLLFWDIIFAPVPGAFETPWQRGPLDIGEDSFYYARQERLDERLSDIKAGRAQTILADNDDRYRAEKTCCIGVNWDICGREDLIEIVECLGGIALSSICRLFCEDYHGRCSGAPDLVVWNPETKECKFVEVKGPGDNLAENQKVRFRLLFTLWSDALLSARCAVEVCRVLDSTGTKKAKKETPKPSGKPRNATASASRASKGKGRARAASVDSNCEGEEESQLPVIIDLVDDDDDAWTPSTETPIPPSRATKRRRSTVADDDELPIFAPELEADPSAGTFASTSKRRKTI